MSFLVSDLVTRVTRKLDDTSFDTSTLIDFANDTEREIFNRYRINTAEQQLGTITTTAGSTAFTGLPTAVGQYIDLRVTSPVNNAGVIPYIEYEDVDLVYPNASLLGTGPPLAWSMFDGVPALVNQADATYTISARYTMTPTKLTSVNDTPNLPEEFSEITVLGMYARACEFNDEFDKGAAARQQMNRLAMDYVDATRRQAGTPHIMREPRNLNRSSLGL